jgi:HlyD family secretion protein
VHRSYLGTIESSRASRLSFKVGGKIISVFADEGQPVQKGELLAELDTRLLHSERDVFKSRVESSQAKQDELIAGPRSEDIDSAKAEVRRWESQQKLAGITARRLNRLVTTNSVSPQEADEAVYNEQVVQAQLELAQTQLTELKNGTRTERIVAQRATVNQFKSELKTVEIKLDKSQLLAPYDGIISLRLDSFGGG